MTRRSIAYANSPLLTQRTPLWRSRFVLALLALAFAGLIARAVYVQVLNNDFIQGQGDARMQRTIALEPSRGRIVDRNGLILATSVPAYSLWVDNADPNLPGWNEVAKILGRNTKQLRQYVTQRQGKGFTWVAHQLDEAQGQAIAKLGMAGVFLNQGYKRAYPEGEAAAHILGFTNIENSGQEGVELAFDEQLSGRAGSRRVIKDRFGHIVEDVRDIIAPVHGRDVQLTIDSKVQFFAYDRIKAAVQKHQASSGSVVVLNAQSGEILALANYPSYDPNNRATLRGPNLRNRAITDSFEPGSTVKPLIVGLALQEKLVKPTTTFNTAPGYLMIGRSRISDSHAHGVLTVSQIIEKSSNVGTVKISERLSPQDMWSLYSEVGLGQRPPLPFPGVTRGALRPYQSWKPIEKATMSYGYGLSASLLQLARAYTVFAGEGHLANVSLIKSDHKTSGTRVFDPIVAQQLRGMLALVTGDEGTAPRAQAMGYSVGGKTGTAHKLVGGKYADKKYRGFFVGLAPIDQPRVIVAVMLDEPKGKEYFGGLVAAPVFSETVQQTLRILGVPPDMSVQPNIHAQGVEESL
jgi:cell division protein FtsI (penicillin-binding protein 3)